MASTKHASSPHAKPPTERNVKHVVLGDLLFKTWYQSIYPEDLVSKDTDQLYVCCWCFRYSCDADTHVKHMRLCEHRTTPPGPKIYEQGGYAVWEVDGEENKLYAQNLSLFAKLFLDHKSVFFDVATFLYYILTFTDPQDPDNYHILGFFSKEKLSWDANNLACILIFPPYQHKQLGKLLMGISYKISAWEEDGGFIGGPEKPLSEMGARSYSRFWQERIERRLLSENTDDADCDGSPEQEDTGKVARKRPSSIFMSVREIGQATGMLTEDVITALKGMSVLQPETPSKRRKVKQAATEPDQYVTIRKSDILEWMKNRHVSIRDPVREEGFVGKWAPTERSDEEASNGSDEEEEGKGGDEEG
ncbi:putative histone acetyltransferase (MysT1) [Aspergillus clavatus NRRL 1]|uniref:histone acetyltransferase n=1 Tax=Aspergillus clavatus (strain ATCC 1007 / CBS 513.65 / DSM 816 / NCTC 3887 / NRRL 1 / QM 1276 / 107) TaxID=344612 RepID=A1CK57_ASPCL|nr:histone acetyltransferase (MysT1), putative [Aspergillus clavatus NRRL 1]EAW09531.1 histone acetyltransferase (MysT1), putative [Aspergillus clavatus NRRL 1]